MHFKSKSDLHYTRDIAPKRVTCDGAHLRSLAPGKRSSEETSQQWRIVGDTVSNLTYPRIKPMITRAARDVFNHCANQ